MRPTLDDSDKKMSRFTVRFKADEAAELELQADMSGLSVAEFIRRRALGKIVMPATDIKTIAELRRLGGLFKLFFSETGGLHKEKTAVLLDELQAAILRVGQKNDS
jgi:hypothetical protein